VVHRSEHVRNNVNPVKNLIFSSIFVLCDFIFMNHTIDIMLFCRDDSKKKLYNFFGESFVTRMTIKNPFPGLAKIRPSRSYPLQRGYRSQHQVRVLRPQQERQSQFNRRIFHDGKTTYGWTRKWKHLLVH